MRVGGEGGVADRAASDGAVEADQLAVGNLQAQGADAGSGTVPEVDLGDDDLDAHLREQHVDLGHELVDEADIIHGTGDHDGIAALLGQNGEQRAELVGGVEVQTEAGDGDGWGRGGGCGHRGGHGRGGDPGNHGPEGFLAGTLGGVVLAGDELAEDGGDILGGGVLEVDDLVARVGVGLHVEFGDQLVEERQLPRVADDNELVGAVVGVVSGGAADLILEGPAEKRADLVHDLAGLGEVQRIKFGLQAGEKRLVQLGDETFDPLEVADGIGDKGGVALLEDHGLRAGGRVEQAIDLGHELVDAQKSELKELAGHPAAGSEAEC